MVDFLHLKKLPQKQREHLTRQFFIDVYYGAFSNPNQMEGPETWLPLMGDHTPPHKPRVHIIVARDDFTAGGVVFEFYPDSECWLATYMAVRPDMQHKGIASQLMREMIGYITNCTSNTIIFAETENPEMLTGEAHTEAQTRLNLLDRLGLRELPFAYVQPALGDDKTTLENLKLLCYAPDEQPPYEQFCAGRIKAFLTEFYTALQQEDSVHLQHMCHDLDELGVVQVQRLIEG